MERAGAEELRDHAVSAHAGGNLLVSILAVGEAEPTNRLFRVDGLHVGIIGVGFHPVIAFGGAVEKSGLVECCCRGRASGWGG